MDLSSAQFYAVCMMLLGLHLIAVPVFIWALRNRQIAENESAVRAVLEDEAALPERSAVVSVWKRRLFFATLSIIFAGIGASIVLTVVSSNAPAPVKAASPSKMARSVSPD